MDFSRSRFSRLIRIVATIVVILIVVGYAAYRSLAYIRGPVIQVFQPINGASIASTTVTIIGRVDRVNSLALNDNPIQVDESGNFKQTIIVFPGINIVTLEATDQFKRATKFELRLFGTKELPQGRVGTTTSK
ncbi:MAG TPA: hypothetical protein VF438_01545 [Candidatus Paceibacterota bacterium]